MKIFDWMHRKFHPNVDYCMVSRKKDSLAGYEKKASALTCETEALLHGHVTLVDPLDGWEDGILSIGTFGLDQLKPFPLQEEYSVQEEGYSVDDAVNETEEEETTEEGEEREDVFNPLAVKAFKQELEKVFGTHPDAENDNLKPAAASDNPLRRFLDATEFNAEDVPEKCRKKKGERTTLADLFSADAAAAAAAAAAAVAAGKCGVGEEALESRKKQVARAKHVRSLAKKLLPWKTEESRPTRKIHRLVTKMLKRKIHPELDREMHGPGGSTDGAVANPGLEVDLNGNNARNESISLLHDAVLEL